MVAASSPIIEHAIASCRGELSRSGSSLIAKVKEVVRKGNERHVLVKHDGRVLLDVPLTVGVVGMLAAPQVAVLGTIAALVTDCSLSVERPAPAPPVGEERPDVCQPIDSEHAGTYDLIGFEE